MQAPRDQVEHRGLAGPVRADDPERLALLDPKVEVLMARSDPKDFETPRSSTTASMRGSCRAQTSVYEPGI